jgi:two-component system, NtrC family, response regulator AtoC
MDPSPIRMLICDDEELIRWSLGTHFTAAGYHVREASNGQQALDQIHISQPDILLLDLRMPERSGMEVMKQVKQNDYRFPIIVLTAHGAIDSAIMATKLGSHAYLSKPFKLCEVQEVVEKALEASRLHDFDSLQEGTESHYGEIVGNSPAIQEMVATLKKLNHIHLPTILITGESGTGKDLIAKAIHENGDLSNKPMMTIDCASLSEQLVQSELFGHEKGAFTDAHSRKKGLFELAQGGIIFLDEIGELSMNTQSKLLRTLESRTFKRVGGLHDISLNATVIAATNRNLSDEVELGRFREDLFYRLDVIHLRAPPLRERRQDIGQLTIHFIKRFNRCYQKTMRGLTQTALRQLEEYSWPGNVRELRNVVERALILGDEEYLSPNSLPPSIRFCQAEDKEDLFRLPEDGIVLEDLERSLLEQAMERTNGKQAKAARLLGISRYTLRYRLIKHGLLEN